MTEGTNNTDKTSLWRFSAPRFWALWIALGILRIMHMMPLNARIGIGRLLGRSTYRFSRLRRGVALRNIELCFPEMSDVERTQLVREHFENLGIALIEISMTRWSSDAQLEPLIRYEGLEHLEQARESYSSFIILTAHFTTLEIGGRFLKLKLPIFDGIYRPFRNPFLDEILRRVRLTAGRRVIRKSDIKEMVKSLRSGVPVWYAPDQSYNAKYAELIDFFGEPAMTNTATGRLATLGRAGILPFFCWREKDNSYVVRFYPPLDVKEHSDPVKLTHKLVGVMEHVVREQPAQYYWVHRRFKNRPEPLPDPYAPIDDPA